MAINPNSNFSIPETTLTQAAQLACQGNWQGAAQLIQPFVMDTKQMAVIMGLLESAPSDPSAAPSLQNRISAILTVAPKREIPQIPLIPQLPRETPTSTTTSTTKALAVPTQHLCFSDTPAFGLANTHPSTFEFGGTHYPNAWVCFFAQQYTDQPEMMRLILQCESQEQILEFVSLNPMTERRMHLWNNSQAEHVNQHDVMMHVLRAKFGQNPELKEQLLATGSNLLICQGYDSHWNDCFNMTGKNQLGKCLMLLREEYGGANAVKSDSYIQSVEELENRCQLLIPQTDQDVWMNHILSQLDLESCSQLSFVSKRFSQIGARYFKKILSSMICPYQTIDTGSGSLPRINKWKVLQWVNELGPLVEDNEGCTVLIMREGLTLRKQIERGKELGITVNIYWEEILPEIGDIPLQKTYAILITNNVFINSRDQKYHKQKEQVTGLGCEMPTVQEYVALCTLTQSLFQTCLYKTLWGYGLASTQVKNAPLMVGGSSKGSLFVYSHSRNRRGEMWGAGGMRRLC